MVGVSTMNPRSYRLQSLSGSEKSSHLKKGQWHHDPGPTTFLQRFYRLNSLSGSEKSTLLNKGQRNDDPELLQKGQNGGTKSITSVSDRVRASWALPGFENSSQICVGVLELVSAVDAITDWHDKFFLQNLYDGLQEEVFASALPNVGADCSNSDATCSEEGTIKKQKRKKGKTGVRIEISREKILQCSKMRIGDAARELNVSSSTLRRICRDYGIPWWPPRKIDKVGAPQPSRDVPAHHIDKVGTPQPSHVVLQEGISQLTSDVPPNQASDGRDYRIHLGPPQNRNKVGADDVHIVPHNAASQEMEMVMIKAKYSKYTIKFRLPMSSGMQELQLEVAKRLCLEAGTYDICYKDEDDDFILIACDEDLQCCMQTSRSLAQQYGL